MANRWGNSDNFLGLQNHRGGDYSHEIKRCLLLGRKAVTNLDSVLKSRNIILLTKVCIVEAMIFPVVMYQCELDHKESWVLKNWCFWTTVLEKTLESPLDCKEIKSVNSKGNQPWIFERTDAEAGVPILWPPEEKNWLIRKDLDAGKDWKRRGGKVVKDKETWHATVHGVSKSWNWLSNWMMMKSLQMCLTLCYYGP